jgi:hypothetical protein
MTEDDIRAVGRTIGQALYRSTYNGERNIPCLSVDQEYTAGLAAKEEIEQCDYRRRMKSGD